MGCTRYWLVSLLRATVSCVVAVSLVVPVDTESRPSHEQASVGGVSSDLTHCHLELSEGCGSCCARQPCLVVVGDLLSLVDWRLGC